MTPQIPTANSKVVNVTGSSLVSSISSSASTTSTVPTSHTSALHTATDTSGQGGPQNQQQPGTVVSVSTDRRLIWHGIIEFQEMGVIGGANPGCVCHDLHCTISCNVINGEQEVNADKWINKLTMRLLPRPFITTANVTTILKNSSRYVSVFFTENSEAVQKLNKFMCSNWIGCVKFTSTCELKIMLVSYESDKQMYLGAIPNDQEGFLLAIRQVFDNHRKRQQAKHKMQNQQQQPQQQSTIATSMPPQTPTANSKVVNVTGNSLVSSPTSSFISATGRRLIWQGIMEFLERGVKGGANFGRVWHNLHCKISCNAINGEQVNADKWPNKLTMQLLPRPFITTPNVTTILKNSSRYVYVFFTEDSEAVQKLNKFMSSNWIGCVQFTPTCELRIMLVLYTCDKQMYMGAIPTDQEGFLSAIRQIFNNHRKQQQAKHKMLQEMSGGSVASSSTIGLPTTNPSTQTLIMNQTNATNIVASSQLEVQPTMHGTTQPAVVLSNQQQQQSQTQSNVETSHNQPTSLSKQQRLSQLDAERQQNLHMCQQHQQQQQEQQHQQEQLLMQCDICSQLQSGISQIALTSVNQHQQACDDTNMLES